MVIWAGLIGSSWARAVRARNPNIDMSTYLLFVAPSFLAAPVTALFIIYLYRRHGFFDFPLMLLMGAAAVWATGHGFELLASSLDAKMWSVCFEYTGIVVVPVAWLLLGLHLNDQLEHLRPWIIIALSIVPCATLIQVFMWQSSWPWFWSSKGLARFNDQLSVLSLTHGPTFWVHLVYSYLVQLAGGVLVLVSAFRSGGLYRQQRVLLVGALALPWIANATYVLKVIPIDSTPLFIVIAAILVFLGMLRYGLGDLVPFAREKIFSEMQDGVLLFDNRHRLIDANQAAVTLFGKDASAIGTPAEQALARHHALLSLLTSRRQHDEIMYDGFDQKAFRVTVEAMGPEGDMSCRLMMFNDLSVGNRIESKLRLVLESTSGDLGDDFFHSLTRSLALALGAKHAFIGVLDDESQSTASTLAFWSDGQFADNFTFRLADSPCANLRADRTCVVADSLQEQFPNDTMLSHLGATSFVGARLTEFDQSPLGFLVIMNDGAFQHAKASASVLEVFGIRAAAELERQKSEARLLAIKLQLQHAQKLESLGVMAGGIAHDFNNLLTPILGYLDLAETRLNAEAPAADHLDIMRDAVSKLADLSNQMLTYTGKLQFVKRTLDLNEVIERLQELMFASIAKNVHIECRLMPGITMLQGDQTQLEQVVVNLIVNASESMDQLKSGTILISTGEDVLDKAALKSMSNGDAVEPGNFVYIEVTDEGCGMAEKDITRLFEPFFSTKFTGRGLGMAVVFGVVKGHGGAIRVTSALGLGTSVRVYLPATHETDRGRRRAPVDSL